MQRVIESAIGGMNIGTTVEGRFRFPINVRYPPELRDDPEKLKRILVTAPNGVQIPLGHVARIQFNDGPPVIKSESGLLLVNIPVALDPNVDIGGYVERAQAEVERALASGELTMPSGYYTKWSGQYEFMQQVKERLKIIVPITLALIFILIFWNMGNVTETLITMGTLPFALIGGVWGMYWLGYNWSVAVAIGFIALAVLAAETGIIMHVYLDLAYRRHRDEKGRALTTGELEEAVIDGAVLRVRPKLMTVLTDFLALLPILWATTAGAGPMKRIAIPVIGGVITSTVHTLILIPVYYALYKRWEQWRQTATNGEEISTPFALAVGPLIRANPGDGQPRTCQDTIPIEKQCRPLPPGNGPCVAELYSARIHSHGWRHMTEPMCDSADLLKPFIGLVHPVWVPPMNGNHRRVCSCASAICVRRSSGIRPNRCCRHGWSQE